jgi:cytoskeletal protein CcmA (bactofilin family)
MKERSQFERVSSPLRAHGRRTVALLLVVALLLPAATGVGAAQSAQSASGTVVVEEGETVDSVDAFAGTVVVRGTVTGDVSGAAGTIRIAETGRVGGNVEAAGGSVVVAGTVDGNVEVGSGSFELTETGRVGGTLDVGAGNVVVDGTVDGDVRAAGDSVTIGPNADVGGEFRYDADEFTRSPDATVAGEVVEDPSLRGDTGTGFGLGSIPSWVGPVYGFAANLLLGAVLLLAFPRFSETVAARARERPLVSGGVGLLLSIGVPVALVVVAITVVGIPLALVGLGAYAVGLWVASVYGQYAAGAWLLDAAGADSRWLALVAGLVAFALLGAVPLVGWLFEGLVLLLGLGALGHGLRGRYRGDGDTATPAAE